MTKRISLAVSAMLVLVSMPALGQAPTTFPSADAATQALVVAIQNDDQATLRQILGADESLLQSDDETIDGADRRAFITKYNEMHRLERELDGTTVLYVGAENWPFPVPLESNDGSWYFDTKRGAEEVLYRRIGENELAAIDMCHALVDGTADSAVTDGPYHGYAFRKLPGKDPAYVAYPVEYRSSGVMTFIIDRGVVYEKDNGPSSADRAKAMSKPAHDATWKPAE